MLKPRKIINRLPDIDMWIVCENGKVEKVQEEMSELFKRTRMCSSDVNPVKSIEDVEKIVTMLKNGDMPSVFLPIDAHIIEYSKIKELIEKVPNEERIL